MPGLQAQANVPPVGSGALDLPGEQRLWAQHLSLRGLCGEVSQLAHQLQRGECSAEHLRVGVGMLAREFGLHVEDEERVLGSLRRTAWASSRRDTLRQEHQIQRAHLEQLLAAFARRPPPPALSRVALALVEKLLDDMFVEEAAFLERR